MTADQHGPSVQPQSVAHSPKIHQVEREEGDRVDQALVQECNRFSSVSDPKLKDFSVEFLTRFRSLASRSRIDRFPIFSSATSVILVYICWVSESKENWRKRIKFRRFGLEMKKEQVGRIWVPGPRRGPVPHN
uniref:Uncharacterized protein n=1 Tax=Solanum tuberosum TaxID=4113 RepID=M1DZR2_SOLTU